MESKLIAGVIKGFRTKRRAGFSVTEIDVLSKDNQIINIVLRDNYKVHEGTKVQIRYKTQNNQNVSISYTNLDRFRFG